MATQNDDWGCLWVLIPLGLAGWWFSENYEAKNRNEVVQQTLVFEPSRPIGKVLLGTATSDVDWYLVADTVTGERTARVVWVSRDHERDETVAFRKSEAAYEINCDRGSFLLMQLIDYSPTDEVVARMGPEHLSEEPGYAPPNSMIRLAINEACRGVYDPPSGALANPSTAQP